MAYNGFVEQPLATLRLLSIRLAAITILFKDLIDIYLLWTREKVVLELATDKLTVWMFDWMFDRMHQAPTAPIPGVQSNTKSLKLGGNQQLKNCQENYKLGMYLHFLEFPHLQEKVDLLSTSNIYLQQIALLYCKLHTVQYILHTAQYILHTVHYILHTVQ